MDKFNKETFGVRLKELLQEKNETIYSIAEILHLSPATISRYQNGEMSPKITAVEHLAEYFNVNPSWLMGFPVSKEVPLNMSFKRKIEFEYGSSSFDLLELYKNLVKENKLKALEILKTLSSTQ